MLNTTSSPPQGLYQVCWKSVVGEAVGRERPVPRYVAEFMARDEALANPLRRYWVERCDRAGSGSGTA
ncbi:hypothetical protein ACM64Y_13240 [Novispirillum sp. DQ9]|uniref:hypothetical protein n=1 Tax=Novispirillum sp. DQ9 TaxID=3398612 RepID=UPI003C79A0BB